MAKKICIGKRRKREERKKERKEKKKKEKRKKKGKKEKKKKERKNEEGKEWGKRREERKGGKQTENEKQGGVSSDSVYYKSLDFPWSFPALLGQELALLLSVHLVFWGRGLLC